MIQFSGIAIIETDTVAGIFCKLEDEASAMEIYKIKERPLHKPLAIYSNNIFEFVEPSLMLKNFIQEFEGEPITVVAKALPHTPFYCQNNGFAGIRMLTRNHPFTKFIEENNLILIGTSANKSGEETPKNINDVELKNIPTIKFNACNQGMETSVIKFTEDGLTIIREGFNITKITNWVKNKNYKLNIK